MKKVLATALAVLSAIVSFADAPSVTDVVAKQRYPWNGLVDITCTVSDVEGVDGETWFSVAAVMPGSGATRRASHFSVVGSTDHQVRTNGNYQLLWDARTDLGQVSYSNMIVRVNVVVRKKIQLWAGGPYWADANIGAELPSDPGYYFWWGDTVGYVRANNAWVASDGSTNNFSFVELIASTYNMNKDELKEKGWITAAGVLTPDHDAAHEQWGGKWRMPTYEEWGTFIDECDLTWMTTNGVYGCLVRGTGDYAAASIFLPAAGWGKEKDLFDNADASQPKGYYWSSEPRDSNSATAKDLCFFNSSFLGFSWTRDYYKRYYGLPIRPVQDPGQ